MRHAVRRCEPSFRPGLGAIALVTVVLTTLLAGCGGSSGTHPGPTPSGEVIRIAGGTATPYGVGAGRVWILIPRRGAIGSVVVYLHGWTAYLPFDWQQTWFEHLLARGSAIVFPAYQDGIDDSFVVAPYDMRDGLVLGFRALRRPNLPVVAVGFSLGATLAFVYAAQAGEWGVPVPKAVYSIFPVDPYEVEPSLDLAAIHGIPVLLRAGDHDDVVGRIGSDALAAMLGAGEKRLLDYRIIHSGKRLWADHELLPTSAWDPATRKVFWTPLDRLVQTTRAASR